MYKEKLSKLFFKYVIPQMIGLLFNSIYLIVDGIFIGNRLGRDAMAAPDIAVPLIFMYPLNVGIAGAALAIALGPIFSVLILLPHFLLKKGYLSFERIKMSISGIREIFKLGFPDFMMEFTIGIVTFI